MTTKPRTKIDEIYADESGALLKAATAAVAGAANHGASEGQTFPPSLFLIRPHGSDGLAFSRVDVSRFMHTAEGKDQLAAVAPTLVKEAGAKMVIFATEAWALFEAPDEEMERAARGEIRIAESPYRRDVLSVVVQAEGHGAPQVMMYVKNPTTGLYPDGPDATSLDYPDGEVETRFDFFAPTIEELLEGCDPNGPLDGSGRGL